MREIRLVARDPEPDARKREPDEPVVLTIPDPVVDEEFVDARGRTCRRWVGPPEAIAANALVNPLTAHLFSIADRVRVQERGDGKVEEWTWIRKSDGRILLPE